MHLPAKVKGRWNKMASNHTPLATRDFMVGFGLWIRDYRVSLLIEAGKVQATALQRQSVS